jgi:hypothetical protein
LVRQARLDLLVVFGVNIEEGVELELIIRVARSDCRDFMGGDGLLAELVNELKGLSQ